MQPAGIVMQRWGDMFLRPQALNAASSLNRHWPEYLMEAGEVGLYLFFTCIFATLLQHPASPIREFIVNGFVRRH